MSSSGERRRSRLFSVFIGHLHPDVTEEDIFNLFSKCGTIRDFVLLQKKDTQMSRYGFVRYGCMEEAVRAIKELNGWSVKSQRIIVDIGHDTAVKINKDNVKHPAPVPAVHEASSLLPVENHFDSIKNMVRVKEACVKVNATSYSENIKISRINTGLASLEQYASIARTSKPLQPRSILTNEDSVLGAFGKLSGKSITSVASVPVSHQSQPLSSQKNDTFTMETLLNLLSSAEISEPSARDSSGSDRKSVLSPKKVDCNKQQLSEEKTKSVLEDVSATPDHTVSVKENLSRKVKKPFPSLPSNNSTKTIVGPNNVPTQSGQDRDNATMFSKGGERCQTSSLLPKKQEIPQTCSPDASSSSTMCMRGDGSHLTPSVRNSRLVRMSGKNHGPAARLVVPVPFLSPFGKGYNSEGNSSPDSSSSLSS